MPIRAILVPVSQQMDHAGQRDAALRIARRLHAHLNVVFIRPDAAAVFAALPDVARNAVPAQAIEQEAAREEARFAAEFDRWRNAEGLAAEPVQDLLGSTYARWSRYAGPLEVGVLRWGRVSDLIVVPPPGAFQSPAQRVFDAAVFDTGRPVLVAGKRIPDEPLRHVLIAWNGSLEVVRAVAGALPLLHAADRVSVFSAPGHTCDQLACSDAGDLDLPGYLEWHGITAARCRADPDQGSVGAALLHAAKHQGATMIVMGSYTRSRVRSILLGGVTEHVLRHAAIPVLMAH